VRTITVPATAVLLGKANWWPSKTAPGMKKHITLRPRAAHVALPRDIVDETSDAVPSLVGAGPQEDDDDEYEDRLNRCHGA
jgi:RND superfamily putative drug exporter